MSTIDLQTMSDIALDSPPQRSVSLSAIVDKEARMEFDGNYELVGPVPEVRYIKLGQGNKWAERALRDDEIPLSFREVPHELALSKDKGAIASYLREMGKAPGAASNAAAQLVDFYSLPESTIWITFADGLMWYAQAREEVIWRGSDPAGSYAPRIRRTLYGWRCTNKFEVPFHVSGLSSRLTKVASTQMTICKVEAAEYALRRIYNIPEPALMKARAARDAAVSAIENMISQLHWKEFETLIDILLARSGWHRVSALGGNEKDIDLMVEQAVTRETAFVQVKSKSSQVELERYVGIFDSSGMASRIIFACHSAKVPLTSDRPDVIIWDRATLAEIVLANGLFDWLLQRMG
jgi:hypothetical protein